MKNNFYKSKKALICFILYFTAGLSLFIEGAFAEEKLNVLTSISNLKFLTESIAGDRIDLDSIIKGG